MSVALKMELKMAPETTAKTEPASNAFVDFSGEIYKLSNDNKIAEISDDRFNGDGWKQYLAGARDGDVMLGVRGDSMIDPNKIRRFLQANAGKYLWVTWRPNGATTNPIYKTRVLVLSIPSSGAAFGDHQNEFDITLKNSGFAPQVSYDNGTAGKKSQRPKAR